MESFEDGLTLQWARQQMDNGFVSADDVCVMYEDILDAVQHLMDKGRATLMIDIIKSYSESYPVCGSNFRTRMGVALANMQDEEALEVRELFNEFFSLGYSEFMAGKSAGDALKDIWSRTDHIIVSAYEDLRDELDAQLDLEIWGEIPEDEIYMNKV